MTSIQILYKNSTLVSRSDSDSQNFIPLSIPSPDPKDNDVFRAVLVLQLPISTVFFRGTWKCGQRPQGVL